MDWIEEFAKKYGGLIIAGVGGAIVRRMRENMTLIKFLKVILMSIFVSFCVGSVVEEYWQVSAHLKYIIGAVSAVYSKEVLDELEDSISGISEIIKDSIKDIFSSITQKIKSMFNKKNGNE
jgi:Na+/H+ antiporter NhaC